MDNNSVAVCVVGNFKYLYKYLKSFQKNLYGVGNYKGDLLVLTSWFTPTFLFPEIIFNKKIKVIRFRHLNFSSQTKEKLINLNTNNQPNRFKTKKFQWFKLYMFHPYLKKWKYILYIDINAIIHFDISPYFKILPENILYAKADGYPDYERQLISQFDISNFNIDKLSLNFDIYSKKYFQTCIMYFDTRIIQNNTIKEILQLAEEYPISITNEQGILNLYFQRINKYVELPEYVEDNLLFYYWKSKNKKVLITKQSREQFK